MGAGRSDAWEVKECMSPMIDEPAIFAAPRDRLTRSLTTGFLAIVAAITAGLGAAAWSSLSRGDPKGWIPLALAAVMLALPLGTWLLSPRRYVLDRGVLTVERLLLPVRILVEEIHSIEPVDAAMVRHAIRVAGSGGGFGYYGLFWSPKVGLFRVYAGRREEVILLRLTDGRRIMIAPDPVEAFVEALERAQSRGGRSDR